MRPLLEVEEGERKTDPGEARSVGRSVGREENVLRRVRERGYK